MSPTLIMLAALSNGQAPPTLAAQPIAVPQVMPSTPVNVGIARISAAEPATAPAPTPAATPAPASLPAAMPAPAVNGTVLPSFTPSPSFTPAPTYSFPSGSVVAAPMTAAQAGVATEGEEPPVGPDKYFLQKTLERTAFGTLMGERGWTVQGWTELSYNWSSASGSNAPVYMNDQPNAFQMNQNFLRIDRSVDASKKEFQLGGRVEMILPGTDARTTISRNLLNNQLNQNGGFVQYPIDLFQAYGEAFLPGVGPDGTTVRMGKFATHMEWELVQGAETPFLSRSYLFQYNPFTHTGIWSTTPLNDTWTMSNGLALGNDNWFGAPARATYLGQLKWAPPEGKNTALVGVTVTDPQYDAQYAFAFYNAYNFQFTHAFNDNLQYVLDASYSHMYDVPGVGNANWYGFVNYLLWQTTEKVANNFRLEFFDDVQGVRTGTQGLYTAATYGISYTPINWLMIRPYLRYDYNTNGPWNGDRDLWTGGLDCIVRW